MTVYESHRVEMGSKAYDDAKRTAEEIARGGKQYGAKMEWRDEYNDYSAAGRFVVTARA